MIQTRYDDGNANAIGEALAVAGYGADAAGEDLGFQLLPRPEEVTQHTDQQEADCNHPTIMFRFVGDCESNG